MKLDQEYKDRFPEEIVNAREVVENHIQNAKDEVDDAKDRLKERKEERELIEEAERLYNKLDNIGAVKANYDENDGSLSLVAWVGNLQLAPVQKMLREHNGMARWDTEQEFFRVEATIIWY